jgi:uracil-DNA glycosylase family protein
MSSENSPAQPPTGVGLAGLREAAAGCRACELWEPATQTVFGEGPETARIVFVGEQPGDQEDRAGEPFVGPAGKLLDRALADAGIDRRDAYVTNAVKHFRWEARGSRRLHKRPGVEHVRACAPWLEAEIAVVRPRVVVCLGATAAQALLGRDFRVTRRRGEFFETDGGHLLTATVHPSSILRAPDEEARRSQMAAFVADLTAVAGRL